ncbi:SCA7, zinc-binding domain-containing protein [Zopfochytrium polystomum]|nr:SCA7, zinc-binding domain-containing protein [Zopfochytrium polystomum]
MDDPSATTNDGYGLLINEELVVVSCNVCAKPVILAGMMGPHCLKRTTIFSICQARRAGENCRRIHPTHELFVALNAQAAVATAAKANPLNSNNSNSSSSNANANTTTTSSKGKRKREKEAAAATAAAAAAAAAAQAHATADADSSPTSAPLVPLSASTADALPKTEKPERPSKQMRHEAKQKKGGPLDLDKQCGVMGDNGIVCARSITCKIHSVSAKRAVVGRSIMYDALYHEYQTKNRRTYQTITRIYTAHILDSKSLFPKSAHPTAGRRHAHASVSSHLSDADLAAAAAAGASATTWGGDGPFPPGMLTSSTTSSSSSTGGGVTTFMTTEEEVAAVVEAVRRHRPAPLSRPPPCGLGAILGAFRARTVGSLFLRGRRD